jgi:hypothetical protein
LKEAVLWLPPGRSVAALQCSSLLPQQVLGVVAGAGGALGGAIASSQQLAGGVLALVDPSVLAATVSASFKLFLICMMVGWLLKVINLWCRASMRRNMTISEWPHSMHVLPSNPVQIDPQRAPLPLPTHNLRSLFHAALTSYEDTPTLQTRRLPNSTASVLSQVSFFVFIPAMLFTKVAASLATQPDLSYLAVMAASAVFQIAVGAVAGMTLAPLVDGHYSRTRTLFGWHPLQPAASAAAIAASTAAASGIPAAGAALLPKTKPPPQGACLPACCLHSSRGSVGGEQPAWIGGVRRPRSLSMQSHTRIHAHSCPVGTPCLPASTHPHRRPLACRHPRAGLHLCRLWQLLHAPLRLLPHPPTRRGSGPSHRPRCALPPGVVTLPLECGAGIAGRQGSIRGGQPQQGSAAGAGPGALLA